MGISRHPTRRICPSCHGPMELVIMKSPHIDDNEIECINPACPRHGGAEGRLTASARAAARAEEAYDNAQADRADEESDNAECEKDD